FEPVVLNDHALAIDDAALAEACAEYCAIARGIAGRPATDEADDWQRGLLGPGPQRPTRRRAAQCGDEFAPLHWFLRADRRPTVARSRLQGNLYPANGGFAAGLPAA